MTVQELESKMTVKELREWMGYSLAEDEKFKEKMEKQKELDRQANMTPEERRKLSDRFWRQIERRHNGRPSNKRKDNTQ